MNKKLMLLGLCMMGVFSAVHADEAETTTVDSTATIAEDTTVATATPVDEKDKEDCGCKR